MGYPRLSADSVEGRLDRMFYLGAWGYFRKGMICLFPRSGRNRGLDGFRGSPGRKRSGHHLFPPPPPYRGGQGSLNYIGVPFVTFTI